VIVTGSGAAPTDSVGYPWTARYTIASGNLLADFRFNVTAESQGRLQVSRLYQLTDDPGVRDMLSFLLARDTMHQNQWLAAIKELEEEGLEMTPCPSNFPQELELREVSYQFLNFSEGEESSQGRWLGGPRSTARAKSTTWRDHPPWARCPSLARSTRAFRAQRRSRTRLSPDRMSACAAQWDGFLKRLPGAVSRTRHLMRSALAHSSS
jgi:Mn-containing catalase